MSTPTFTYIPPPPVARAADSAPLSAARLAATGAVVARGLGLAPLAFLVIHVPLAYLMFRSPALATLHALATFGVGVLAALFAPLHVVLYVCAYVMGGEVLWRGGGASVFWEYGKYATCGILLLALIRSRPRRWPFPPVLYFLLLAPSAVLTVLQMGLSAAKDQVSFNMSGPFTLALCTWIASCVKLTPERWRMLLLAALGPIVGLAVTALLATLSAENIAFEGESNMVTSGGFGPNQVSSLLGLGVLFAFLAVLDRSSPLVFRILMLGTVILLGAQSALTFSRGGLVGAAGAIALGLFFLLRDVRSLFTTVLSLGLLVGMGFIVAPRLDDFTGGALSKRFGSSTLTGRDRLARQDLEIWREHPVLGTGPGGAKKYRESRAMHAEAAHTELTRLLAEHGSFGLGALLTLAMMSIGRLRRAQPGMERATAASLIAWALLYMLHAAMRTVAPSFIFGLAFAQLPAPVTKRRARIAVPQQQPLPNAVRRLPVTA